MEQKTTEIYGNPGFILESEEIGVFHLIKSISYRHELNDSFNSNYAKTKEGEFIKLKEGFDITETPNRNVSILVRSIKGANLGESMIKELRKHANLGNYDYVSYEPFGEFADKFLCEKEKFELSEVRPRYFRNIPLDDRR